MKRVIIEEVLASTLLLNPHNLCRLIICINFGTCPPLHRRQSMLSYSHSSQLQCMSVTTLTPSYQVSSTLFPSTMTQHELKVQQNADIYCLTFIYMSQGVFEKQTNSVIFFQYTTVSTKCEIVQNPPVNCIVKESHHHTILPPSSRSTNFCNAL